jgi:hypothetical protein
MIDLLIAFLAEKVRDKIADEAISLLVGQIIQSNDEQLQLLKSMDSKIDALLQGSFNAGMIYLRDASRLTEPLQQKGYISKAQDKFKDALGNERSYPARKSWIEYHVALCSLLLDKKQEAILYFQDSYESSSHALCELYSEYQEEQKKIESNASAARGSGAIQGGLMGVLLAELIVPAMQKKKEKKLKGKYEGKKEMPFLVVKKLEDIQAQVKSLQLLLPLDRIPKEVREWGEGLV